MSTQKQKDAAMKVFCEAMGMPYRRPKPKLSAHEKVLVKAMCGEPTAPLDPESPEAELLAAMGIRNDDDDEE